MTIQRNIPSQDAAGQPVESWSDYRTCYADVSDSGGSQTRRGDQERGLADVEVSIRYPREEQRLPLPTDRVVYREQAGRTRTLNIDSVRRTDDRRRMLVLSCREVQDNG